MFARLVSIPDVPPGVCVPDRFELTPAAYQEFLSTTSLGGEGTAVVVRGEGEIFRSVRTSRDVLAACKRCFAGLFSDQAIAMREEQGIDHLSVTVSVTVQRMVRASLVEADVRTPVGAAR